MKVYVNWYKENDQNILVSSPPLQKHMQELELKKKKKKKNGFPETENRFLKIA